jgi:pilus assembly protein Flp/PilA
MSFRNSGFRRPTRRLINGPIHNQRGQGLIEYLIIVALMGVATIAIVRTMGEAVSKKFASITYALNGEKKNLSAPIKEDLYKKKDLGSFLNGVGEKGDGSKNGGDSGGEQ